MKKRLNTIILVLLVVGVAGAGTFASPTQVTLIQTAESIPSKDHPDRLTKYVYNVSDTKKSKSFNPKS